MTPIPARCVEMLPGCDREITDLKDWLKRLDERQRVQGETLAAVNARVATFAAVGGIGGGVVAGVIVAVITHAMK